MRCHVKKNGAKKVHAVKPLKPKKPKTVAQALKAPKHIPLHHNGAAKPFATKLVKHHGTRQKP